MQLTPNYKLKKPEETDPIDILDLNDNTDIIDAELKKRPAASGGDLSEMTVKTLEEVKTEFPVPVAGESTKTFLGKVKKFFEDTKNWMTGVCMLGQLVNNCVTNRSDLPLAAAQGKVLMDLYTQLYSDMNMRYNPDTDYIQCKYDGIWRDFEKAYMHALILYNSGNEYVDITGGWADTPLNLSYSEAYPTLTKAANFLQLQDSGKYGGAKYCTNNTIDITHYNKIIFNISNVLSSTGQSEIGILSARTYMPASGIVVTSSKEFGEVTTQDVEIDISNKSGNWYPFFGYVHSSTAQSSNVGKIIVHSVRLLK